MMPGACGGGGEGSKAGALPLAPAGLCPAPVRGQVPSTPRTGLWGKGAQPTMPLMGYGMPPFPTNQTEKGQGNAFPCGVEGRSPPGVWGKAQALLLRAAVSVRECGLGPGHEFQQGRAALLGLSFCAQDGVGDIAGIGNALAPAAQILCQIRIIAAKITRFVQLMR